MNRKKKIKYMRKFILKHGVIKEEYKRLPDKHYPPYKKGSYYADFRSEELDIAASIGDVDKYQVYKSLVKLIKEELKHIYKIGDEVQFINHKNLHELSGKKGIIEGKLDDSEVIIEDNVYGSKYVYKVSTLYGDVEVLDGFIRPIKNKS